MWWSKRQHNFPVALTQSRKSWASACAKVATGVASTESYVDTVFTAASNRSCQGGDVVHRSPMARCQIGPRSSRRRQ